MRGSVIHDDDIGRVMVDRRLYSKTWTLATNMQTDDTAIPGHQ